MTAPAAPWALIDIDPESALAELKNRFPGVTAWFGEFSGSWWGLVIDRTGQGHDALVEGDTVAELGQRLDALKAHVRPRVPRYARTPQTGGAVRLQTPEGHAAAAPAPPARRPGRHQARRSLLRRLLRPFLAPRRPT